MKYILITRSDKYNNKIINAGAVNSYFLQHRQQTAPISTFIIRYTNEQMKQGSKYLYDFILDKIPTEKPDYIYIANDSELLQKYMIDNKLDFNGLLMNFDKTTQLYPLEYAI